MIRSWVSQALDHHLPPLPAGQCDLLLSRSPKSICSKFGKNYGEVLRVSCRCLPMGQFIGDRPDEETARDLWSVHVSNRRINGREESTSTLA